jgi:hypothetical protein
MLEDWIRRYFPEDQGTEVLDILSAYGTEQWHREQERVKRDVVIISRGSIDKLRATVQLAMLDYRDVLIGEEIDPWVIREIKKYTA